MKEEKEVKEKAGAVEVRFGVTFTTNPELNKYRDSKYLSPKTKKIREQIAAAKELVDTN